MAITQGKTAGRVFKISSLGYRLTSEIRCALKTSAGMGYKCEHRLKTLLNTLLTPIFNGYRQPFILDWILPFIPEIHRTAIRLVFGFIDPDPARKQACITNNQSLAGVKGWKYVTEPAKTIREQSLDNPLVLGVCQPHGYEVAALAKHRLIHFGGTLAYHHKANAVFTAFFGNPLKNIQ